MTAPGDGTEPEIRDYLSDLLDAVTAMQKTASEILDAIQALPGRNEP